MGSKHQIQLSALLNSQDSGDGCVSRNADTETHTYKPTCTDTKWGHEDVSQSGGRCLVEDSEKRDLKTSLVPQRKKRYFYAPHLDSRKKEKILWITAHVENLRPHNRRYLQNTFDLLRSYWKTKTPWGSIVESQYNGAHYYGTQISRNHFGSQNCVPQNRVAPSRSPKQWGKPLNRTQGVGLPTAQHGQVLTCRPGGSMRWLWGVRALPGGCSGVYQHPPPLGGGNKPISKEHKLQNRALDAHWQLRKPGRDSGRSCTCQVQTLIPISNLRHKAVGTCRLCVRSCHFLGGLCHQAAFRTGGTVSTARCEILAEKGGDNPWGDAIVNREGDSNQVIVIVWEKRPFWLCCSSSKGTD